MWILFGNERIKLEQILLLLVQNFIEPFEVVYTCK